MKLETLRPLDILPLPAIYYDGRTDYHMPDDRGGWVAINERHLSTNYFCADSTLNVVLA